MRFIQGATKCLIKNDLACLLCEVKNISFYELLHLGLSFLRSNLLYNTQSQHHTIKCLLLSDFIQNLIVTPSPPSLVQQIQLSTPIKKISAANPRMRKNFNEMLQNSFTRVNPCNTSRRIGFEKIVVCAEAINSDPHNPKAE